MAGYPEFRSTSWLKDHVFEILEFYYPECIDEERGGYVHQFSDLDGRIYDRDPKHLVGTCRFVFDFAVGELLDGPEWCHDAAAHGVEFLLDHHRDQVHGGFTWLLDGLDIVDGTKYCYGHAFALLALAMGAKAGVSRAQEHLDGVYDVIDRRFWEDEHGLCRSEFSRDWEELSAYRGQNGNMHTCEAMLAAYEATGEGRYLDRADTIATTIARDFVGRSDGLVWEHYTAEWELDWEYNVDAKTDLFRPWGFLAGHQLEWTKLLLVLERHRTEEWLLERARGLFDRTVGVAWDDETENGGLIYTFDRDGNVVDDDRYYWVLAEALAAAALLARRTGDERYWEWYDRLWEYSWDHLVNHDLGIWYRVLSADNDPYPEMDNDVRVKTDYHTIGACYEIIRALDAYTARQKHS